MVLQRLWVLPLPGQCVPVSTPQVGPVEVLVPVDVSALLLLQEVLGVGRRPTELGIGEARCGTGYRWTLGRQSSVWKSAHRLRLPGHRWRWYYDEGETCLTPTHSLAPLPHPPVPSPHYPAPPSHYATPPRSPSHYPPLPRPLVPLPHLHSPHYPTPRPLVPHPTSPCSPALLPRPTTPPTTPPPTLPRPLAPLPHLVPVRQRMEPVLPALLVLLLQHLLVVVVVVARPDASGADSRRGWGRARRG